MCVATGNRPPTMTCRHDNAKAWTVERRPYFGTARIDWQAKVVEGEGRVENKNGGRINNEERRGKRLRW